MKTMFTEDEIQSIVDSTIEKLVPKINQAISEAISEALEGFPTQEDVEETIEEYIPGIVSNSVLLSPHCVGVFANNIELETYISSHPTDIHENYWAIVRDYTDDNNGRYSNAIVNFKVFINNLKKEN